MTEFQLDDVVAWSRREAEVAVSSLPRHMGRDDAIQCGLIAGWLAAASWSPAGGASLKTRVESHARYAVFDWARSQRSAGFTLFGRSRPPAAFADAETAFDSVACRHTEAGTAWDDYRDSRSRLPMRVRVLLALMCLDGMNMGEAAAAIGLTQPGATRLVKSAFAAAELSCPAAAFQSYGAAKRSGRRRREAVAS